MEITRKSLSSLAELARLDLTSSELEMLAPQLSGIVELFEQLNALDLDEGGGVAAGEAAAFREDEARRGRAVDLDRLCPDLRHGHVAVPRVVSRTGGTS